MGRKKGYNHKARSTANIEIDNSTTKKVYFEFLYESNKLFVSRRFSSQFFIDF